MVETELSKLAGERGLHLFSSLTHSSVGEIDFLLVGPFGTLVVECDSSGGRITAGGPTAILSDGSPIENPLTRAYKTAIRLERLLIKVGNLRPRYLVCFPAAREIKLPPGCPVSEVGNLSGAVEKLPAALTGSQVEELASRVAYLFGAEDH